MNQNPAMEVYYTNNTGSASASASASASGYPNPYQPSDHFMGFFDPHPHPHPNPTLNYVYPHLPMPNHQETAYWSMNMNYRSEFSDAGTTSYYGYDLNDPLPRTEINRRTWEYSPSMHIQDPTMLMHSQQNVVTTSDAAEECPVDDQGDASPEVAWQDDIDPDSMTYEELLDLGEAVGTQSRGLSQELIKLLPTSRYKAGGFFSRKKARERCVICLVTYKIGDQQMALPCKHVYHSKCGRKWLSINKTCPVCNSEVFGDEQRD
ncbi:E3 ubiquitin-protein ligase BIG BROTHER [Spinacia oleracea]|uniref:E3 ubiquitin-protein ligase BIG BROTHER n=1 Tax=Spinacia oleracea TaxID=3562 RepID=A0A9R0IRS7_SPIOL|nr:E3 ubiquitin-protein ligase BIG BROTHER-like [Spinacia oleracea]XP_056691945.1 E3 ubiquitin-protein ligase BIG BROTHER-like [Spinacia oleracea]